MGIMPDQLDCMTPRQLSIYSDAYNMRVKQEVENKNHEIYTLAKLTATFVWSKRIPSYEKVFKNGNTRNAKKRVMTDDEMYQTAVRLNKAFGGNVKNGGAENGSS